MSDTIHGKPGVATRSPSDKEAPLPLRKRGKGKMPAYGKKMSTAEIQSLIAYIRTLK